jgi:hypothetical protein
VDAQAKRGRATAETAEEFKCSLSEKVRNVLMLLFHPPGTIKAKETVVISPAEGMGVPEGMAFLRRGAGPQVPFS